MKYVARQTSAADINRSTAPTEAQNRVKLMSTLWRALQCEHCTSTGKGTSATQELHNIAITKEADKYTD
jgi:hypothetical protein